MSLDRGLNANRQSKPWKARTRERERETTTKKERTKERQTGRHKARMQGFRCFISTRCILSRLSCSIKSTLKNRHRPRQRPSKGMSQDLGFPSTNELSSFVHMYVVITRSMFVEGVWTVVCCFCGFRFNHGPRGLLCSTVSLLLLVRHLLLVAMHLLLVASCS